MEDHLLRGSNLSITNAKKRMAKGVASSSDIELVYAANQRPERILSEYSIKARDEFEARKLAKAELDRKFYAQDASHQDQSTGAIARRRKAYRRLLRERI